MDSNQQKSSSFGSQWHDRQEPPPPRFKVDRDLNCGSQVTIDCRDTSFPSSCSPDTDARGTYSGYNDEDTRQQSRGGSSYRSATDQPGQPDETGTLDEILPLPPIFVSGSVSSTGDDPSVGKHSPSFGRKSRGAEPLSTENAYSVNTAKPSATDLSLAERGRSDFQPLDVQTTDNSANPYSSLVIPAHDVQISGFRGNGRSRTRSALCNALACSTIVLFVVGGSVTVGFNEAYCHGWPPFKSSHWHSDLCHK